ARYLDTTYGRIALVSMASTFNAFSMAMAPQGEAPARPGMNPLRLTTYALVTPDMMLGLRRIRDAQPPGSIDPPIAPARPEEIKPGDLELLGVHYRTADLVGFGFEMNALDLQENLQSIRQGK